MLTEAAKNYPEAAKTETLIKHVLANKTFSFNLE